MPAELKKWYRDIFVKMTVTKMTVIIILSIISR